MYFFTQKVRLFIQFFLKQGYTKEKQDWVFEVKLQIRFDFDLIKLSFDQLCI